MPAIGIIKRCPSPNQFAQIEKCVSFFLDINFRTPDLGQTRVIPFYK